MAPLPPPPGSATAYSRFPWTIPLFANLLDYLFAKKCKKVPSFFLTTSTTIEFDGGIVKEVFFILEMKLP